MNKHLYGRITIDMNEVVASNRRETERKRHFYKRMKAQGVRGTSIRKYLRRGFPGPFGLAMRQEMEQLVLDMKRTFNP